jgi:hypothetical protein
MLFDLWIRIRDKFFSVSDLKSRYRDILFTNTIYTLQSLYVTKFIQTLFICKKLYTGQSLYSNKKFIHNKIYTVTKFIQT